MKKSFPTKVSSSLVFVTACAATITACSAPSPQPLAPCSPETPRPALVTGAPQRAHAIAAWGQTACAILTDGGLACWGRGFGTTPRRIRGVEGATAVALTHGKRIVRRADGRLLSGGTRGAALDALDHVESYASEFFAQCVLRKGGEVLCGPIEGQALTAPVGLPPAKAIAVGRLHGCALDLGGELYCFEHGVDRAFKIHGVEDATEVSIGAKAGCVRRANGDVLCFALEPRPRVSWVTTADRILVADVCDGTPFPFLCSSRKQSVSCASIDIGEQELSLAQPTFEDEAPRDIVQIAGWPIGLCVLDSEGAVHCRGSNQDGFLGRPHPTLIEHPRAIEGVPPLETVVAGMHFGCGLARDGAVHCVTETGAFHAAGLGRVTRLVAGYSDICAFDARGIATCGRMTTQGLSGITRVPALDGTLHVDLGRSFEDHPVLAIDTRGALRIGAPDGHLGLGSLTLEPVAAPVPFVRVLRSITSTYTDVGGHLDEFAHAFDAQGRAYSAKATGELPATVRRDPALDGTQALNRRYRLTEGGALFDTHDGSDPVRARVPLVTLVRDAPCGLSRDAALVCVEQHPLIEAAPQDRVLSLGVRAVAGYTEVIFAVDLDGRLSCVGDNHRQICGAPGPGLERSDKLVRVDILQ